MEREKYYDQAIVAIERNLERGKDEGAALALVVGAYRIPYFKFIPYYFHFTGRCPEFAKKYLGGNNENKS